MKKIALAAALSMAATSSFAGSHMGGKYAEPVIEPEIIVEDTRGTAAGIVVPILLLVALAAVVASR